MSGSDRPFLYFLLWEFPSPTEYFILNEIDQLERRGVKFKLLAVKGDRTQRTPLEMRGVEVSYAPKLWDWGKIWRAAVELLQHGRSYCIRGTLRPGTKRRGLKYLKWVRDLIIVAYWGGKLRRDLPDRVHAHFVNCPAELALWL